MGAVWLGFRERGALAGLVPFWVNIFCHSYKKNPHRINEDQVKLLVGPIVHLEEIGKQLLSSV